MKDYLKMTDEDRNILITLYNYIKLVKPEERISLHHDTVKYIFIDGPSSNFMTIYCKHKKIVLLVTDEMEIPSWFKALFHLRRVASDEISHSIPMHRLEVWYKYFIAEVKDKELLK